MYDFHDDARHHHGSQCKHWTAFKKAGPQLGLGIHSLTPGHSLDLFDY